MTHLSELEIVDQIEGALPPARAAHIADCSVCRAKIEQITEALARAHAVEIPEPSPLFWEHFSSRIRKEIAEAPEPGSSGLPWAQTLSWQWLAASLVVALLLGAGAWRLTTTRAPDTPATVASSAPLNADDPSSVDAGTDADQAWALVQSLADEVEWSDSVTADLAVRPGWVDRAALDLTSEERKELLRLLKAETRM